MKVDAQQLTHAKQNLRPFQYRALIWSLAAMSPHKGVLIADEPGLGKTLEAISILEARRVSPVLVVCPAGLRLNWEREIRKWVPGRPVEVKTTFDSWPAEGYAILSYDALALGATVPPSLFRGLVMDEIHNLRGERSKRTQAALAVADAIPWRIGLSGTPLINRPLELLPPIRALGRLWMPEYRWKQRYCGPTSKWTGRNWVSEYKGESHLDELRTRLREFSIRRTKEVVAPELPPKARVVVPVEITNRAEYRDAEKGFFGWLDANAGRLAAISGEPVADLPGTGELARLKGEMFRHQARLRRLVSEGKRRAICEWTRDFLASGQKLLGFSGVIDTQMALLATFPRCASILGAYPLNRRMAESDRFMESDCKLLVASEKAAGEGYTLTATSNVAVYDLPWSPMHLEQIEDRAHRIGQTLPVTVWILVAVNTIEERILALLDRKQRVVDRAIEGRDDTQALLALLRREPA